jgi:hypothetical protein
MDRNSGHRQRNPGAEPVVITENRGDVGTQVQETMDGVQSTVRSAVEGFRQVQDAINGVKTAVEQMLGTVKGPAGETVERLKPATNLLDDVRPDPWLLLGSAVLLGYLLGNLAREPASSD